MQKWVYVGGRVEEAVSFNLKIIIQFAWHKSRWRIIESVSLGKKIIKSNNNADLHKNAMQTHQPHLILL